MSEAKNLSRNDNDGQYGQYFSYLTVFVLFRKYEYPEMGESVFVPTVSIFFYDTFIPTFLLWKLSINIVKTNYIHILIFLHAQKDWCIILITLTNDDRRRSLSMMRSHFIYRKQEHTMFWAAFIGVKLC